MEEGTCFDAFRKLLPCACMHSRVMHLVVSVCRYQESLERVSNPLYCCINGVFSELHHKSAMNIIMPWWVEPKRHTAVVVCVCMSVCVYVFHTHFSATAKN